VVVVVERATGDAFSVGVMTVLLD